MLPEIWRTVRRLLLCCIADDALLQLDPALQGLHQVLPNVDITLLTLHRERYEFLVLSNELKLTRNLKLNIQNPLQEGQSPTQCITHNSSNNYLQLIQEINRRSFDAAIIFTTPSLSPYSLAYLCYLAGIPIRLGQSHEFGGSVLSHCIQPPLEAVSGAVSATEYYLNLLQSAGFPIAEQTSIECVRTAI